MNLASTCVALSGVGVLLDDVGVEMQQRSARKPVLLVTCTNSLQAKVLRLLHKKFHLISSCLTKSCYNGYKAAANRAQPMQCNAAGHSKGKAPHQNHQQAMPTAANEPRLQDAVMRILTMSQLPCPGSLTPTLLAHPSTTCA